MDSDDNDSVTAGKGSVQKQVADIFPDSDDDGPSSSAPVQAVGKGSKKITIADDDDDDDDGNSDDGNSVDGNSDDEGDEDGDEGDLAPEDSDGDGEADAAGDSDDDGEVDGGEAGAEAAREASGDGEEDDEDLMEVKSSKKLKKGKKEKSRKDKKEKGGKKDKKRRRSEEDSKKKKKRSKTNVSKFFLDQADVADDDEEEEEDYDRTQMMEEEILDKDKLAAIAAVERRHEEQRRFMEMSAEEKAKELEERFRRQEQARRRFGNIQVTGGNDKSAVAQQARNPSNADPPIFKVKCKPGSEMMLVRSILLKALESKSKGGFLLVKSAFFTGVKGCIYIEAVSEPFAKEAINGLRGHYPSSFVKIPLTDMTAVLTVAMKKKPIREGQWVRMRRGLYKGDLARVVALFDGGEKAFVQVVPRLDYSAPATNDRKSQAAKIRPTQRLFDPEEAKAVVGNGFVFRRHHPLDNNSPAYDVWQNDYFRDGLLYKEVTVATYLSDESVNPKLEELQLFLPKKSKRRDDDDDADDYDDNEQPDVEAKSFIEELAQQIKSIGEDDDKDTVSPFVPGDLVQITGGDMANFLARVKSVNDSLRVATVVPYRHSLTEEMQVELSLLVRYIETGNHVKVVSGKYTGQTGQVVSVDLVDGVHLATIITDTVNTQIRCNVAYVQMSTEVAVGYGNLMGYELYDLVFLNENESAVIISVGAEKLKVINHLNIVKDVFPQEIQSKRNVQSERSNSFDSQQNTVKVGDTVNVVSGAHAKLSGTVKHIMKGNLWLHSIEYLKTSGVFVVKARNCVVAGNSNAPLPAFSAGYKGVLDGATGASGSRGGGGRGGGGGGGRIGKDSAINQTVKIKKGAYKGLLAQVIDATPTHFHVELLAKLKKVVIERDKAVIVGNTQGSFERQQDRPPEINGAPATPYLTSQTPMYIGSETPRYGIGNETPLGSRTPGRTPGRDGDDDDEMWKVTQDDEIQSSVDDMSYRTGTGYSSTVNDSLSRSHANSVTASSSVNSPLHSSNYSPSLSSQISSKPVTPMYDVDSVIGLDTTSTTGSRPLYMEWTRDMVVTIKAGEYREQDAIIIRPPNERGILELVLRGRHTTLFLRYDDVALARPPKGAKLLVFSGKLKGRKGTCKTFIGNDVLMHVGDALKPEIIQLSLVAWIEEY